MNKLVEWKHIITDSISPVDPASCSLSLAFFCKVLNTVWTGNAGLDVWMSSRQLCRAEGDTCPLQDPFLSVRWETSDNLCWLPTCCASSLWGGSTDFCSLSPGWPSVPSLLCLLFLCCVLWRKIGAILMSFAPKVCSWSGLTFLTFSCQRGCISVWWSSLVGAAGLW